jgi:hypothetical protein
MGLWNISSQGQLSIPLNPPDNYSDFSAGEEVTQTEAGGLEACDHFFNLISHSILSQAIQLGGNKVRVSKQRQM